MKEAYKQWFYGKVHNFFIANILGQCAYMLFVVIYWLKMKRNSISSKVELPTLQEAERQLNATSPCPQITKDYNELLPQSERIKLSMIVPIYNYENVLRETLESIVKQKTRYNYEVVLIDDGSTDRSGKIADEYEEYDFVKVIHQENKGIAAARNKGIENSRGKYIMFVDCDDILDPLIVEKMVSRIEEEKSDIVECGFYYFKMENDKLLTTREFTFPDETLLQGDVRILRYPGLPWAKVFRREIFEKLRFPQGFWFEDTIIHCIAFQLCKKITFVNECLYGYRVYEQNYTKVQQKSLRSIEHLWIVKYMIDYAKEFGIETDPLFYETILRHLGPVLCNGTGFLGEDIQKSLFVEASSYLEEVKGNKNFKLNYMLRQLEESLEKKDFKNWKLVCQYL